MDLQYLSDADGNQTAVVVPIDEWRELTAKRGESKLHDEIKGNKKLSEKYAGKLPTAVAEELQKYVEQSRAEWS